MHQVRGSCLTLLICVSACLAAETKAIRLSGSVGDAVDAAARDRYGLFPGVQRFRDARFLLVHDSTILAVVTTGEPGATGSVTYRLSSWQFERIRFLVTNSDRVRSLTARNPHAARAVRRFWMDIESTGVADRLAQFGGHPLDERSDPGWLDRKFTTLTGATIGSGLGGWLATSIATKKVGEGYRAAEEPIEGCTQEDCLAYESPCAGHYGPDCSPVCGHLEGSCVDEACAGWTSAPPPYRTNWAVYYGTYVGVTALGAGVGYVVGRHDDSRLWGGESSWDEGDETGGCGTWTTRCLCVLPGLVLGGMYVSWAKTLYGREDNATKVENGNELQVIPAFVTGVCIAVDVALLVHKLSQAFSRNRAARRNGAGPVQYARSHPEALSVAQGSEPPDTLPAGIPGRTP